MKIMLNQEDVKIVENKIKDFEMNTGCELLVVVAKSSDSYPAASWRFGFYSALIAIFIFSLYFEFHHSYYWPGIFLVLTPLCVWLGGFDSTKKWALNPLEVDRECYEKSIECFHKLGTSKVEHKVTAMIMVSLLERKIMVLVDEKLKSQITQEELDELVSIMRVHFKQGNMCLGFIKSIESFEQKILKDFGGKVSEYGPKELKDEIIFL
jgi:uncharacterized membrane protein